jgi:hypothetical protein
MYQPFMPNFVKCFRKITEYKTANFLFFSSEFKMQLYISILGENQIDIHKLACFFVDG